MLWQFFPLPPHSLSKHPVPAISNRQRQDKIRYEVVDELLGLQDSDDCRRRMGCGVPSSNLPVECVELLSRYYVRRPANLNDL